MENDGGVTLNAAVKWNAGIDTESGFPIPYFDAKFSFGKSKFNEVVVPP